MTGSWYTLKFVPDLMVNQPYNVGVVSVSGTQIEARFLGEDKAGHIDGRKLPRDLPTQTYRDWVAFTRRTAERGELDSRIRRMAERGRNQFIIEKRGPVFADRNLRAITDELYARVVTIDHRLDRPSVNLTQAAEGIVKSLDADLERDVTLVVQDRKKVTHSLPFAYRHVGNNNTTLLDRINVSDTTMDSPYIDSLLYRIDLAETQGGIHDFVVFVRAAEDTSKVEKTIRQLERYANTVDVEDESAAHTVASILNVGMLNRADINAVVGH